MKYFFSFMIFAGLFSFRLLDDIYSLSFKTIDGNKIELNTYRGKKMLFVILPLSAVDTTLFISALETLHKKYDSSLVVIGIVAEETGFKKGDEKNIKKLYENMKPGFFITEGIKVKKASGNEQSTLLQWLTNKDKNRHFDNDAQGIGQKFFVDEAGELYAVMGPQTKLSNPVIDRILSKPFRKSPDSKK